MTLRNLFFLLMLPVVSSAQAILHNYYPTGSFIQKNDILLTWQIRYDSSDGLTIRNQSFSLLDSIALMMKKKPGMVMQIGVFESWPGPVPTNLRKTEYRVRRISDYLIASGVQKKNIIAFGFGEDQLLYTHDAFPEKNNQMQNEMHEYNRRVEFKILDDGERCFSLTDTVFKAGTAIRNYEISEFPYAKAKLEPESYPFLDSLAAFLISHPNLKIEIGVHLDNGHYQDLPNSISSKRAKAIKSYLINKGVQTDRLDTRGYKTTKPIISFDEISKLSLNEQKYQLHMLNRRTEFKIISVN